MLTKNKLKKLLIWISFLCCTNIKAQTPKELFEYSNECFKNASFSDAIKNYKRLIFFDKEIYGPQCYQNIGTSYYKLAEYNEAINYFDLAYNSSLNDSIKLESIFNKVLCYMQLKSYDYALLEIFNISDSLSLKNIARKKFYEGSIYYMQGNYEKALESFENIYSKDNEYKKKLNDIYNAFLKENKFSVNRAKILSYIIPGLGQAYSGDYKNSINSFLLTAGFVTLYLTVASTISPIEAIVGIGPWFQRYYQGGIKHSGLIAQKKKEKIKSKYYITIADFVMNGNK